MDFLQSGGGGPGMILEALVLPDVEKLAISSQPETKSIECLLCEKNFGLEEKDEVVRHLLVVHSFVIADVHLVADFPKYIRYWKEKFRKRPLTAYCTSVKADVVDKSNQKDSDQDSVTSEEREFSLLSDIVPEDRELRQQLQRDRLEQVLSVHEQENASTDFSRSCLFCKMVFTYHPDLFDHMAFDHNFSVGQPANIVFINKFLDLLQEKLDKLICLFCEKTFKSREVLKEHMRKKGHKKLNPHNKEYDEFYLVNYLEFGKNWEDISKDPMDDEVVSGFNIVKDEDDGNDGTDWKDNLGKLICLFCPAFYSENKDLFEHMNEIHGFSFEDVRRAQNLDFYQQIKLINYIRRCVYLNSCLGCAENFPSREKMLEHLSWSDHHKLPSPSDWNQPEFFFPTYENDNLLHSLEEMEDGTYSCASPPVLAEELDPQLTQSILQDEKVRKSLMKSKPSSYNASPHTQ